MRKMIGAIVLVATGGCSADSADIVEVDYAENAEQLQAAYSYDFLLNCWAEQWPDGKIKRAEDMPPGRSATQGDITAAIAATRKNCERELAARQVQIRVDLAEQGLVPPELSRAVDAQLEEELQGFFVDYWGRL